MSYQTLKYTRALEIDSEFTHFSSDELYRHLQNKGYRWDSNMSQWDYSPTQQNDSPSQLIKIRLLYDRNQIKGVAEKIIEALADVGFRCVETSFYYPCRPPKGNDGRVYLVFQPPETL